MNEWYIPNKIQKLFHVKPSQEALKRIQNEIQIEEIMEVLHSEIEASSDLLIRKIAKMLSMLLNEH